MKMNLALWDRIIRFILGVLLTGWALAGGPWWGYFGVYCMVTSGWGLCPLYSFFKIRTAPAEVRQFSAPE